MIALLAWKFLHELVWGACFIVRRRFNLEHRNPLREQSCYSESTKRVGSSVGNKVSLVQPYLVASLNATISAATHIKSNSNTTLRANREDNLQRTRSTPESTQECENPMRCIRVRGGGKSLEQAQNYLHISGRPKGLPVSIFLRLGEPHAPLSRLPLLSAFPAAKPRQKLLVPHLKEGFLLQIDRERQGT